MDPISITVIVVAGSIVISSAGRFIGKKYHSYTSRSHDHEVEMTTEETSVDGTHKKVTVKFHGKNHGVNISDEHHQEHGDSEAVKALASLSSLFSVTTNISSAESTSKKSDNQDSKTDITTGIKKVFIPLSKKAIDTFAHHNNSGDAVLENKTNITEDNTVSSDVEVNDRFFRGGAHLKIVSAILSKVSKPVKIGCVIDNEEETKQEMLYVTESNNREENKSSTSVTSSLSPLKKGLNQVNSSGLGEFFDARDVSFDEEGGGDDCLSVTSIAGDSGFEDAYSNEL